MAGKAWLKLYNENSKELFLESVDCDVKTKETYGKLLKTIGKYEYLVDRDLYTMNAKEILDMYAYLKLGSEDTAVVLLSVIKLYIKWAITAGNTSNLNDILSLTKEDILRFVSYVRFRQQYIKDEEELQEICEFCVNFQDSGLFVGKYYGISGYEHDSLVNLQREDLTDNGAWVKDFEYVTDGKGEIVRDEKTHEKIAKNFTKRFVEIPPEFMRILKNAANENEYLKGNNMSKSMKANSYELEKNSYVFRQAQKRTEGNDEPKPISAQIVNQRMKKIITLFSGKKKYKEHQDDNSPEDRRNLVRLNPQLVTISGVFNQLRKLEEKENRELQTKDYEAVLKKFNISPILVTAYKNKYQSFKEML